MQIGPLITQNVVTIGPDHNLAEAARRMVAKRVGSAVVLKQEGQPGIITERDLLRAVSDGVDLQATTVERYMTGEAITASSSWEVMEAARRMVDGGFRHLVVLDDGGQIRGMLSIRDLVQALLEEFAAHR